MTVFQSLVDSGRMTKENLEAAEYASKVRNVPVEKILRHEYNIPRKVLLEAMASHYGCGLLEYDERLAVPPELLWGLDRNSLKENRWFPVIKDGEKIVIAAVNPKDPATLKDVERHFKGRPVVARVAIGEDIDEFIKDFLNSTPDHLSGNERSGLAFWRNTMSRWRTRLACYRTDFARARTSLSLLRGGLGLITLGRTFLSVRKGSDLAPLFTALIALGFVIVFYGLIGYIRLKLSIQSPPGQPTVIEVTNSTLFFLENYRFIDEKPAAFESRKTMLARMAADVTNHRISMEGSFDNKARSALAHERNIYAAQRTILSCYRTLYARARVGLSFIRTGVSFASIALGLIKYFGLNLLTALDFFLLISGILLIVDGLVWYLPVHREQSEAQHIPSVG